MTSKVGLSARMYIFPLFILDYFGGIYRRKCEVLQTPIISLLIIRSSYRSHVLVTNYLMNVILIKQLLLISS